VCCAASHDGWQSREKGQCSTRVSRRPKTPTDHPSLARIISLYQNVKYRDSPTQTTLKVCADLVGEQWFHVSCCFIPWKWASFFIGLAV